jgi:hypothetical protein
MIFGREPAFIIGVLGTVIVAVAHSLAGQNLIGADIADTLGRMLDPTQGGWLLPILIGLVTRIFVSPAEKPGL